MKISEPQIEHKKNKIIYRVCVESINGNETLWYSLNESFGDFVSNSCDAPLVGLLIPAMENSENIYIDGTISERLYYNLSGPFQKLIQHIIPSLHQIKIYPKDICVDKKHLSPGVATGFSGGIDSYCVLADHYYSETLNGFKISHLLFNNVGSHGKGGEKFFKERYSRLLPLTERMGLPFLMINSNLDVFYDNIYKFQQTHTLRNASVALLLQRGIGRFMYASGINYLDVSIGLCHDTAYSDSISLPLLSVESLELFSVGSEYTRVEKTLRVADVIDSYKSLDVCLIYQNDSGYTNCGKCSKCLRTLATLEIAGKLDCYSVSFDINAYENCRYEYFVSLLRSHEPLLKEIVAFASDINYKFPAPTRITSKNGPYQVVKNSKKLVNKIRRLRGYSKKRLA